MFRRQKSAEARVRVPEHRKVLFIFSVVFGIYAATLIFVFGWLFLNSFKTGDEYATSMYALPKNWLNFDNYESVLEAKIFSGNTEVSVVGMFLNSLLFCLTIPTISVLFTSGMAYALAKYKFRGREFIYFLQILPMMFSLAGTQVTTYQILDKMEIMDTPMVMWITATGTGGMNFLLLYGTYKNISDTYMEAASIDGAGHTRIYLQIMLPQAMGIIGTLWMFGFIGVWNDYASINMFVPSMPTLAVGLEGLKTTYWNRLRNRPIYYAGLVVSLVPIIVLFLIFQEQIMKLSLGGGIKG